VKLGRSKLWYGPTGRTDKAWDFQFYQMIFGTQALGARLAQVSRIDAKFVFAKEAKSAELSIKQHLN